ncbi:MAG: hypothetical protein DME98_14410 [Verrucomicrobia bacterium]|nr:MAG: hypothetical protein DME98_14410 [Verrucomicrobiota bacterium]PYJ33423.1 MAG: hypothetical protein DME88_08370 [Verrucomicrobiota bacterium]
MTWSEIFCKPRYETAKNQVLILIGWMFMWNGTTAECCMVASGFKKRRAEHRFIQGQSEGSDPSPLSSPLIQGERREGPTKLSRDVVNGFGVNCFVARQLPTNEHQP